MAQFFYKAMTPEGRIQRGQIDAVNLIDLEMRLKRMDLDFILGKPVRQSSGLFGEKIPRPELINFCFHLEQLTRAGVPIIDGLVDLRDSLSHPRFREVIASMVESIEGGRPLSQAMSEHPKVFDSIFVSLVRAGETTGMLPEILKGLSDSLKWQDELSAHTRRLFLYPTFVGLVVLAVTIFLMVYLVPQMAGFITSMGQDLPLQTRILISLSAAVSQFWYLFLGIPLITGIVLKYLISTRPSARRRFDAFLLSLPVFGPILRKIILSRFASLFAMLYASGIAIIEALQITETAVGNTVIQEGLRRAGQLVIEGQNVTAAFQQTELFPPLVIRMLRVGENTGGLDRALLNVAYFYTRDVKESVERLQSMIEPAMTLILGALLGWVMISVLGPIYDVIGKLKI